MLSARSLAIVWGDDTHYWKWTTMPDSRFAFNFSICFILILFNQDENVEYAISRYILY
jgi:hypothetical protein